ncbi:MAG: DUF3566 domain-containing protein [Mycobacteriaceae bacterium]
MSTPNEPASLGQGPEAGSAQQRPGGLPRPAVPQGPKGPAPSQGAPTRPGGPTGSPPWQRGVENHPQANPEQQRVAPAPVNHDQLVAEATRPAAPASGQVSPMAADASAKTVATPRRDPVKTAVIDAPTRNIARNDLPKDMPDLSGVRHPGADLPMADLDALSRPRPRATVKTIQKGPLRASMQIRRIDPWSTLKLSLVVSAAMFFVWMFAVGLLYLVLGGMGVWDRLNSSFTDMVSDSGGGIISASSIFGGAAVIGVLNIVVLAALATMGAFIYNLAADVVGGVEVTLADRD